MADQKISGLTSLTGANTAAGDLFVVVDISDTTMAASGTDKKITRDELNVALGILPPTVQYLTNTASSTYTTPAGCTAIIVELIGGGGGGGACAGSATQAAMGSGGGSGGYTRKLIANPSATYTYQVGAKGTGGAAGANNGNPGSTTTFGTITALGGGAGVAGALGTALTINQGGAPAVAGANGDMMCGGSIGGMGVRLSATAGFSGSGGDGPFGGGANLQDIDAAGAVGFGPGSGGGGAHVSSVNTARAGGDGVDGIIIVTEFYG